MRPRLAALSLLVLLAACGGPEERPATPARDGLAGTADVERLPVSTQRRKSPKLQPTAHAADVRCGTAKVRVVKDLKGTVVVRS